MKNSGSTEQITPLLLFDRAGELLHNERDLRTFSRVTNRVHKHTSV